MAVNNKGLFALFSKKAFYQYERLIRSTPLDGCFFFAVKGHFEVGLQPWKHITVNSPSITGRASD